MLQDFYFCVMLANGHKFIFKETELVLLPEKAIWFPSDRTLLISDVHLGKGGHFRKSGIAIPAQLAQEDLANLSDLIHHYQPKSIIFLGDLFHSDMNNDWDWFCLWRELHHETELILVKGNHDILPVGFYDNLCIKVIDEWSIGPFTLKHDKPKNFQSDNYLICGHIHPGIKLRGKGRQSVTVPCFWFGRDYAILPAFGKFTGKVEIKIQRDETVFAIAGQKVLPVFSKVF